MRNKRLIIMTESSKFSGKCVAGIDIESGEWVRLVSDDEETHGAIANRDLYYQDGGSWSFLCLKVCIREIKGKRKRMFHQWYAPQLYHFCRGRYTTICQHMPRYAILPLFGVCRPCRLTS